MNVDNLEYEDNNAPGLTQNRRIIGNTAFAALGGIGIVVVIVILVVFAFMPGSLPLVSTERMHPSDAILERVFEDHEADFNQLIAMSNEDAKVIRIAPDFTWLEDNARWPRPDSELGFPTERWNQYRKLFEKLGLDRGIARDVDGKTIEFIASSRGLLTGGSGKGYMYSTKEREPIYSSLDNLGPTGKYVYKKLKPPYWYLFYYSK